MATKFVLLFIFSIWLFAAGDAFFFKLPRYVYKFNDIIENSVGESKCAIHLKKAVTDLIRRKKWALQMVDSTAKPQPGLMTGNLLHVGNFDQCIKIHENFDNDTIDGKYCSVLLEPSRNFSSEYNVLLDSVMLSNMLGHKQNQHGTLQLSLLKIIYGICIPKSCSIGNLQKIWDNFEQAFQIPVRAVFVDSLCHYQDKIVEPYDIDIYVFIFFGILICVIVLSTFYDITVYQYSEQKTANIWISFSVFTNFKKLMTFYPNQQGRELACINGIKVLSMCWVILGHRFLFNVVGTINTFDIIEWKKKYSSSFIFGGVYAVDTFLALSGILLTFRFGKFMKIFQMKTFPYVHFYVGRILRLSPALLGMVLFMVSIFKYTNDGPAWSFTVRKIVGSCKLTWWATIFFVMNHISMLYQCLEHTWYLAVDTQLYIISPLILINLYKHPWKVTVTLLVVCIISTLYAFFLTTKYKLGCTTVDANKDYMYYIYQSTFLRMPVWIIGVLFGYLLCRYGRVNISKPLNLVLWTLSLSLMLFLILIHTSFARNSYNPFGAALFNAIAKPLWSLALCVIVYSCATGNAGVVNDFLSLPIFHVIVRFSYSIYLVHLPIQEYMTFGRRTVSHYSNVRAFHDFGGDVLFIIIGAIIWCMAFETPFRNIAKLIFKKELGHLKQKPHQKHRNRKRQQRNYVMCINYVYTNGKDILAKKEE